MKKVNRYRKCNRAKVQLPLQLLLPRRCLVVVLMKSVLRKTFLPSVCVQNQKVFKLKKIPQHLCLQESLFYLANALSRSVRPFLLLLIVFVMKVIGNLNVQQVFRSSAQRSNALPKMLTPSAFVHNQLKLLLKGVHLFTAMMERKRTQVLTVLARPLKLNVQMTLVQVSKLVTKTTAPAHRLRPVGMERLKFTN